MGKDRGDADDAIRYMDGNEIEGQRIAVSRAGERPPPNASKKEAAQNKSGEVLTTTNFEREERRTAQYLDSSGLDKRVHKSPPSHSRIAGSKDEEGSVRDRMRRSSRSRGRGFRRA